MKSAQIELARLKKEAADARATEALAHMQNGVNVAAAELRKYTQGTEEWKATQTKALLDIAVAEKKQINKDNLADSRHAEEFKRSMRDKMEEEKIKYAVFKKYTKRKLSSSKAQIEEKFKQGKAYLRDDMKMVAWMEKEAELRFKEKTKLQDYKNEENAKIAELERDDKFGYARALQINKHNLAADERLLRLQEHEEKKNQLQFDNEVKNRKLRQAFIEGKSHILDKVEKMKLDRLKLAHTRQEFMNDKAF